MTNRGTDTTNFLTNGMNWNDYSRQAADEIIRRHKVRDPDGKVRQLLEEAVRKGMEYECESWCIQRTK